MSGFRFLNLVRPFLPILPEVSSPDRKVPFNQKVLWTAVTLLIFLVCSQVPLYGIMSSDSADPLYWMRVILASNRGTLMELGITPIVTSGMIMQLLAGANLIEVDFSLKEDRALFSGAQKPTVYVLTGLYGQPRDIGAGICLLLIIQLISASLIVILLDELLQKGLSSGRRFRPQLSTPGVVLNSRVLSSRYFTFFSPGMIRAVRSARHFGASVSQTYESHRHVVVFAVVIYLQGFRIEIPVKSNRFRGQRASYPVKLFYTSNMPIMLESALTSNVFIISQMLASRFPSNLFVKILGVWEPLEGSPQLAAVSGIAYYMSPPHTLKSAFLDPSTPSSTLHLCSLLVQSFPRLGSKSLGAVPAYCEAAEGSADARCPTAAALGGAILGLLSVVADLMGAIGSGTGILMAVTIIYSYWEIGMRESSGPEMAALGDLF
ncbi:Protein transport protein SEC61 subunit alpha [Grifola frondosa]|uniref:Protein transport protein SEC61 subunit alpha n=1 Tax=Grifola frondosa TaxID=5627 RepID=A0A1C7LLW2_GRIFR|nr:Protein transport protein SEC61 subunit alpha [Grifola frondosa]